MQSQTVRCLPPRNFVPAAPVAAEFLSAPPFARRTRRAGAIGVGLRFERRVLDLLGRQYPGSLIKPWVRYMRSSGPAGWCQPDGVIFAEEEKRLTIVEVKNTHTSDAWFQLRKLYEPVLRCIYREYDIQCVEVCKNFDPHRAFPSDIVHIRWDELSRKLPNSVVGVCIW